MTRLIFPQKYRPKKESSPKNHQRHPQTTSGKDWKNLVKNPSFIAEHLQQSSHQNPSLLLFQWNRSDNPSCWPLRLLDCDLHVREIDKVPFINSLASTRIVDSCNGLLCVETSQYKKSPPSLSLWNPATTTFRDLPISITANCFFNFDDWVTGFGFGPIVNDYKIVRTYVADCCVNRVEVFSISRELWKAIDVGNLKGVLLNSETVTANGSILWIGLDLRLYEASEDNIEVKEGEYDVRVIVSFDIAKEVFTLIPKPHLDYGTPMKLTAYENKLAMLCDIGKGDDGTSNLIDLWVLDEGKCSSRETWSWTARYAGSPFLCRRSHSFLSTIYSMTI
ncbi:F-box protein At3g07870-like [Neltuma alba]|uniref:F-box protein At3g07870-like n=1 Tax=Neltuma alba TaxID=207710 RepID=UPI0010A3143F|nr:F-box protein At3g07870-like [Prosopis alba]